MYGKIFTQMYDGTLAMKGPWEALVTFQQLIVLANKRGEVDMTADAIARRTTIPIKIIEKGLRALEAPDPGSRTPDEDGRRIARLADHRDWGWRIVNYDHYNTIRSEEERAAYHRAYNAKRPDRPRRAKKDRIDTTTTPPDTGDTIHTLRTEVDNPGQEDTPVAVAVAVPVIPPPPPAGETAVSQLLDQAGRDYGAAKAIGWAKELKMMRDGGRGVEYACTADQLETACRELLLQTPTGQKLNMKALQGFIRRAVRPLTVAKASALPEEPEGRMAKMIREAIGNDSTRRK